MQQNAQHITFPTPDGLTLPGLLYEPKRKTKRTVIFIHGLASTQVFYDPGRTLPLAQTLNRAGIAFLAFNNRGAHMTHRFKQFWRGRKRLIMQGAAFEKIRECVHDIDGTVSFLRKRGYSDFTLIGHSTGANKICVYNALKKRNPAQRYVLFAGGDDTGLTYRFLGPRRFAVTLNRTRDMIKKGHGLDPVPRSWTPGYTFFSYQAFWDMNNPDGWYNCFPFNQLLTGAPQSQKRPLREYRTIRKPTLVLYGSEDEYCYGDVSGCVAFLQEACPVPDRFTFTIVPGADHVFHNKERVLASTIARWLKRTHTT